MIKRLKVLDGWSASDIKTTLSYRRLFFSVVVDDGGVPMLLWARCRRNHDSADNEGLPVRNQQVQKLDPL